MSSLRHIPLCETIHKDPTCFDALHKMGLPDAFYSFCIISSLKAPTCVPKSLGAICLNADDVVEELLCHDHLAKLLEVQQWKWIQKGKEIEGHYCPDLAAKGISDEWFIQLAI